jgi:hypothetical protein
MTAVLRLSAAVVAVEGVALHVVRALEVVALRQHVRGSRYVFQLCTLYHDQYLQIAVSTCC